MKRGGTSKLDSHSLSKDLHGQENCQDTAHQLPYSLTGQTGVCSPHNMHSSKAQHAEHTHTAHSTADSTQALAGSLERHRFGMNVWGAHQCVCTSGPGGGHQPAKHGSGVGQPRQQGRWARRGAGKGRRCARRAVGAQQLTGNDCTQLHQPVVGVRRIIHHHCAAGLSCCRRPAGPQHQPGAAGQPVSFAGRKVEPPGRVSGGSQRCKEAAVSWRRC